MKDRQLRIVMVLTYCLVLILVGFGIGYAVNYDGENKDTYYTTTTTSVKAVTKASATSEEETLEDTESEAGKAEATTAVETEPEVKETKELLGEFTITYYCSCKKCCGEWAENRPVVNGKEIVYTASSAIAEEGVTVAVDHSKIPYGTVLYIEGLGYRVAQDCGSAIKGNKIDIYMNSHEAALQGGIHTATVWLVQNS